jgi:hypothetical protein
VLDEAPQACYLMDARRGRHFWANRAGLKVLGRTLQEHLVCRSLDGLQGEQLASARGVLEELTRAVQDGDEPRDLHGPLISGDTVAGLGRKYVTQFSRIRVKNFPPELAAYLEEPVLEGFPAASTEESATAGVWLCLGHCMAIARQVNEAAPKLEDLPRGSFNEGVSLALSQVTGPDSMEHDSTGLSLGLAAERLRALEMLRRSPIFSSLFDRSGGELLMSTPRASAFYEDRLGNVRAPGHTSITLKQVLGIGYFGGKNPTEPAFDGPGQALKAMDQALFEDNATNFKFQQQQLTSKRKKRWIEFECWPAKDPVTGKEAVLVSQTNITQLKGLEVSLKAAQKDLLLQNTQLKEELDLEREKKDGQELNLMGPLDETLAMLARIAGGNNMPSRRELQQLMKTLASARDVRAPTGLKESIQTKFSPDVGMSLMTMLNMGGEGERTGRGSAWESNRSALSTSGKSRRGASSALKSRSSAKDVRQRQPSMPATLTEQPASPSSPRRGGNRSWDCLSAPPPRSPSVMRKVAGKIRKVFKPFSNLTGTVPLNQARTPSLVGTSPEERRPRRSSLDDLSLNVCKACKMYHHPKSEMPPQLLQDLESSAGWQFDAFSLERSSNGLPLSTLGFYILIEEGLVRRFNLCEKKLMMFLLKIEDGYPNNMYHNRTHAADVLQSMYLLMTNALGGCLGDLELLAGIIAAVCHDYKHIGVNNDFLVRSGHDLAMIYNGNSPMENHHASSTLFLLRQKEYDFLEDMDAADRKQFQKIFITLILSTDMSSHFSIVSKFSSIFTSNEAVSEAIRKASGQSNRSFSYSDVEEDSALTHDHVVLALQMSIKMADLGHVLAEPHVHLNWVNGLEEEYFRQGDKEKVVFGPGSTSPLMDRASPGITASQCGFFEIVVVPLYEQFAGVFPGAAPALELVHINYEMWKAKEKEGMEHEKAMKIAAEKCAALLPVEALDKGGVGP